MRRLWDVVHWLFGYAILRVEGGDGERFLSLCRREEIELWGIRRVCPGVLEVRVYLYALPSLPKAALRCGATLREIGRCGCSVWLKRYRFRPGLFLGAVLYLILLLLLSRFVWSVEIPGADPLQAAAVRDALLRSGFGVGTFIPAVDYRALKYDVMMSDSGVTFVSVNQTGSRALVDVRFAQPIPQRIDDDTPCNLIAARDGQIVSVLVLSGVRYVQKGQAVQKGDLLVGGIFDTRLGYYTVHAKGQILARVNETLSQTVLLETPCQSRTGRKTVRRQLCLFGHTVDLFGKGSPYAEYETETEVKHLSFGENAAVPVMWIETVYYETEPQTETRTEEEAEAYARVLLNERERLLDSGALLESRREQVVRDGTSVTVTREYTVIEDIGKEKEFYFADNGE